MKFKCFLLSSTFAIVLFIKSFATFAENIIDSIDDTNELTFVLIGFMFHS